MTRAPSRGKAVKPVPREKGARRPSRRGKADPFQDLPASHREMARDILSRTFPFTLAGLVGKSELPTAERHRPAAELARRHPDVAAAALARALGIPDLNVPDLLAHPKENPLLALDDAVASAVRSRRSATGSASVHAAGALVSDCWSIHLAGSP